MTPSIFESESTTLARALHWRCVSPQEVVEWADRWIESLADPPSELYDLSLMGSAAPGELVPVLERLGGGLPDDMLIPETLGLLGKVLLRHPDRLDVVCTALTGLSFSEEAKAHIPERLRWVRWELEEVEYENYGGEPEIRAAVVDGLSPFTALASAAV
jgi:hypothetical protein